MSELRITAEQTAPHWDVAKASDYRWRERKSMSAHRIGRLQEVQLAKVDEWLRAGDADRDLKCENVDGTSTPKTKPL